MKKTMVVAGIGALGLAVAPLPATAADIRMPVKAPVVVPVAYDWTGFYLGGNVGYSWGRAKNTLDGTLQRQAFRTADGTPVLPAQGPIAGSFGSSTDVDGWIGGGQLGYNWHRSNWLFGIEADIQASGEKGNGSQSLTLPAFVTGQGPLPALTVIGTSEHKLNWFGTLRGRVGFLPTQRVLLYATGGLAYGELEASYALTAVGVGTTALSLSKTRAGWTVGAGAEIGLASRWTAKVEYLYMDLGRANWGAVAATTNQLDTPAVGFNTVTTFTGAASTKFTDHILRVGINYNFGPGQGRF